MTKKLRVTVDGKVYEVTVEMLDEAPASVLPPVAAPVLTPVVVAPVVSSAPAQPAGPGSIKSPLAGKVVSVAVQPGSQVNEGQQVMVLEAMKMNTYIYATVSGHVAKVLVHPGDAVEEGAVLMTIA